MNLEPQTILKKHATSNKAFEIVLKHSQAVTQKALMIADKFPEADKQFIQEAGLLHDIGVFLINSPKIFCYGNEPYVKHGFLGGEILRKQGLPRHARVAETHTGVGITKKDIEIGNLPLPKKDFLAETFEERIISYADLFFSKSNLNNLEREETVEEVIADLARYGQEKVDIFLEWKQIFEPN